MIKTRINDLLGIRYPILQGGMAWISGWEMAAAVSEAGGLGTIAAAVMEPEELVDNIHKTKEATSGPFAVNIPLRLPSSEKAAEIALEEKAPVVVFSAGDPVGFSEPFKRKGIPVLQVAFTLEMVKRCEEAAVDGIIVMGMEGGGNISPSEVSTLVLVREAVEATDIPVIAAGGFADGRGLVAALALGAEGIQMGTRFLATREGTLHENYKRALLDARDGTTTVTGRTTGLQFRVLKNQLAERIIQMEKQGRDRQEIDSFTIGSLKKAALQGDVEWGSVMMGQVSCMISDIPSIKDLLAEIMNGAEREIARLKGIVL